MKGFRTGQFTPANPEKYIGNHENITYRSSWELNMCKFLDTNPNVLAWSSEEIKIQYIKPTDGKPHFYYPDFYVQYRNVHGEVVKEIVEIKPSAQCVQPTTRGKAKKTILYERMTFAVNQAKWRAAQHWCDQRGFKFRVVTEKSLFR